MGKEKEKSSLFSGCSVLFIALLIVFVGSEVLKGVDKKAVRAIQKEKVEKEINEYFRKPFKDVEIQKANQLVSEAIDKNIDSELLAKAKRALKKLKGSEYHLKKEKARLAKIAQKKIDKERAEKKRISDKERAEKKRVSVFKKKLKGLRKKCDDFKNACFYYDKRSPYYVNQNGFFIYFSSSKEGTTLSPRLSIQYKADDWLFINRVTLNYNDSNYPIFYDFKGDVGNGIYEWMDKPIDKPDVKILERFVNDPNSKYRLHGSLYHKDKRLTNKQRLALKNMIEIYYGSL